MSVRTSVCLFVSVTRRYSVETVQYIIKLFSPSGRHAILVLAAPNIMEYSDGDPLTGALNARGIKIAIFDQYLAISEMIQDTAIVYYRRRIGNCTEAFKWYYF